MKVVALGCALLAAFVPGGCGHDGAMPAAIDGHRVGALAERHLEAENPTLAPGTMSCPDLDLEVGASVRCLRTAELDGGRMVKIRGTVAVTSLAAGGRLHVAMEDTVEEFGVAGDRLEASLRRRYQRRFHVAPSRIDCPYLRGRVGAAVTCRVEAGGARQDVRVEVTEVDATAYRTTYVVRARR